MIYDNYLDPWRVPIPTSRQRESSRKPLSQSVLLETESAGLRVPKVGV